MSHRDVLDTNWLIDFINHHLPKISIITFFFSKQRLQCRRPNKNISITISSMLTRTPRIIWHFKNLIKFFLQGRRKVPIHVFIKSSIVLRAARIAHTNNIWCYVVSACANTSSHAKYITKCHILPSIMFSIDI